MMINPIRRSLILAAATARADATVAVAGAALGTASATATARIGDLAASRLKALIHTSVDFHTHGGALLRVAKAAAALHPDIIRQS